MGLVFVLLSLAALVALTVGLIRALFPQGMHPGRLVYRDALSGGDVWGEMDKVIFPTAEAAWQFSVAARESGHKPRVLGAARPLSRGSLWSLLAGALLGGLAFGSAGYYAERWALGLPRLEPLFAAPVGSVTAFLALLGACLGALTGALVTLRSVPNSEVSTRYVQLVGESERTALEQLVRRHGGHFVSDGGPVGDQAEAGTSHGGQEQHASSSRLSLNRWLAWIVIVLTAGVLLTATSYVWFLAANYGRGSDQQSRLGYTLKNVQRVPADTPEAAGAAVAEMLGGESLAAPDDPLAAAVLAPLAAAMGQTLTYGANEAGLDEVLTQEPLAAAREELLSQSTVAVLIADEEPVYALPAAYAAAHFRVPVVRLSEAEELLADGQTRLLLVAAPSRLIDREALAALDQYGTVERVAANGVFRHALLWAQRRWGEFGWGIDPSFNRDAYFNFTVANPEEPGFAAAGLPTAYMGNYGPLLYTPQADLDELTDQFLWRLSPDFFVAPSDGPFANLRVVGGPESVSYNAQARADLAVETHAYRNQATGASGMALLGWSWFVIGLAGAIWALFAMPARIPDAAFYPRVYWPLSILVLGPLGIAAFLLSYQGRPIDRSGPMPRFVRPLWARAVSATVMGMGVGMALMIASMYLFELNGLPLWTALEFTPFFWLGAPMAATMWLIMVPPAIALSTLLFMGPMMGEMQGRGYGHGLRLAIWPVTISMAAASVGMWTLAWWWMNWKPLMAEEDLWLWVSPLWWAAAMGFLTALIPNYLMARAGWKNGGM